MGFFSKFMAKRNDSGDPNLRITCRASESNLLRIKTENYIKQANTCPECNAYGNNDLGGITYYSNGDGYKMHQCPLCGCAWEYKVNWELEEFRDRQTLYSFEKEMNING